MLGPKQELWKGQKQSGLQSFLKVVLAGLLTDCIWGVQNGKNNRNIPNYMGGNKFYASHMYPQGSRFSQHFIILNWLTYEVLVNFLHHLKKETRSVCLIVFDSKINPHTPRDDQYSN